MKHIENIDRYFLFIVLGVALYFGYVLFEPYIQVIIVSGVFASLLHPVFKWIQSQLSKTKHKGLSSDGIASLLTVILFILVIVVPLSNFIVLVANEAGQSYLAFEQAFKNTDFSTISVSSIQGYLDRFGIDLAAFSVDLQEVIVTISKAVNTVVLSLTTYLIKGTTSFITNLFIMLLTMYYLLKDGDVFIERVMTLTPLPNKYDRLIFQKFRDISKTSILSTLLTGMIQGCIAAIAYAVVGVPVLIFALFTAIASVIPVVGTSIVSVPLMIFFAASGDWFSFAIILIFGIIVGLSDNLIRVWVMKGKADIHPMLLFFAIFGGVTAYGIVGIVFGPLILSILLTILHIYEIEYHKVLER